MPNQFRNVSSNPDPVYLDDLSVTALAAAITTPASAAAAMQVQGNVAHDAVDSGNPVSIGGYASSSAPAAVSANGDRVKGWFGTNGQMVVALTSSTGGAIVDVGGLGDADAGGGSAAVRGFNLLYNGATWDRARGDLAGAVNQPHALTGSRWTYSSGATGILSNTTTAVTVKAAAGASLRNYITGIQISTTAFGATVPIVIRDGAGGTVLWAGNVPTAGWLTPVTITFPVPLKGTANTLVEVATPTANTTGTAWVNLQGYTAA